MSRSARRHREAPRPSRSFELHGEDEDLSGEEDNGESYDRFLMDGLLDYMKLLKKEKRKKNRKSHARENCKENLFVNLSSFCELSKLNLFFFVLLGLLRLF